MRDYTRAQLYPSSSSQIYKNQFVFHIVSIYIPPDTSLDRKDVTKLFNSMANLNNLILTGDFNAHNSGWDSDLSDNRGNNFVDILNNYDLNISISNFSGTRMFRDDFRGRFSSPDITFVTSDIFFKCQWKVLDARRSDQTFKWINIQKVVWNQFSEYLVGNFDYDDEINHENYLTNKEMIRGAGLGFG